MFDIYARLPDETTAAHVTRMNRVIAKFEARKAEGKWSEGRARNLERCLAHRAASHRGA